MWLYRSEEKGEEKWSCHCWRSGGILECPAGSGWVRLPTVSQGPRGCSLFVLLWWQSGVRLAETGSVTLCVSDSSHLFSHISVPRKEQMA
ncbi:hypothetical protein DPEC_G00075370 [Dallia pectoralis]|uniref:Uncharacterized protein n=1 Tax=Dallia pectoralis TaxID=75939 RepID=A0ACC2H435_DALPE|nr:hypothetical protein DPEC_G00075370 [Dallia pectoralis]